LTIRNFLGLSNKLQVDKTDNYRLKVSSVRAIDSVIKSMNRAPIKLQGYKKLQYIIWLKKMRNIPRYSYKINIPNKY
jgi:ubiquinol-cytochrome c reductase cytochrome b subunit